MILEELVDVQLLESSAPGRYRFRPLTRLFALRSATGNGAAARAACGVNGKEALKREG